MARKPSDIVQPNLRIREELRRQLDREAKKNQVSLNYEMTARLKQSLEKDATQSNEIVAADMKATWARFAQVFHALNKQGDLIRAAEALVQQIESDAVGGAIAERAAKVKQVLAMINLDAALTLRKMHSTGGDQ